MKTKIFAMIFISFFIVGCAGKAPPAPSPKGETFNINAYNPVTGEVLSDE